jgi:serine/threonine protein kinase
MSGAAQNSALLAEELSPGHLIAGKYVVDRVLGRGGVGVVVSATHLALEQKVAIKFLRNDTTLTEETTQRFLQEARAAAMMKSEHVARVFDFGTSEQGSAYIVMEHLEGMDLGSVLDNGPLAIDAVVEYVLQTCLALAEAHRAGIVHRDLKPANLFLTQRPDGQPIIKILDFGISKIVSKTPRGSNPAFVTTSANMGSPEYMSPEQMRSAKTVDHRTDIWALGVVMYELLTGHPAFTADTIQQLFHLIDGSEPAPIESFRADVPEALVRVVARCLKKSRTDRFVDVGELAGALRPVAAGRMEAYVDAIIATLDGPSTTRSGPLLGSPSTPPVAESSAIRSARIKASAPTVDSGWRVPAPWVGTRSIAIVLGLLVGGGIVALLFFGKGRAPSDLAHPVGSSAPVATAPIPDPPPPTMTTTTASVGTPSPIPVDALPSAAAPGKPSSPRSNPASSPRVAAPPLVGSPVASAPVAAPARPTPPPAKPLDGTSAYGDRK